jgi:hypothetical protein
VGLRHSSLIWVGDGGSDLGGGWGHRSGWGMNSWVSFGLLDYACIKTDSIFPSSQFFCADGGRIPESWQWYRYVVAIVVSINNIVAISI